MRKKIDEKTKDQRTSLIKEAQSKGMVKHISEVLKDETKLKITDKIKNGKIIKLKESLEDVIPMGWDVSTRVEKILEMFPLDSKVFIKPIESGGTVKEVADSGMVKVYVDVFGVEAWHLPTELKLIKE